MENFEEMKAMWIELNNRVSSLEEENRRLARSIINNNYKTARDKLISKYSLFIIIEIVMIFYMLIFVIFNPLLVEKYKVATIIYWALFFAFEASIDIYLRTRLRKIDIYNSSVSAIAAIASKNWKIHKIAIIIGLPLAFGAIILFGLLLNANEFTIYAMIIGGMVGLLIGVRQLRKFYLYYKLLQSDE